MAEIYQQRWFEEYGHRHENVDQAQLVVASGKLVLQKYKSLLFDNVDQSCLKGRHRKLSYFPNHRTCC